MDVISLQNHIIAEPQYIATVLEALGFHHVLDRGNRYQFPNKNGDNMSACSIWKDNLHYENFSHGERGNLFTLVMNDTECDFPTAIRKIANIVGFKTTSQYIKLPFGGFYKHLMRKDSTYIEDLPEYQLNELPESDGVSRKFFLDGIAYDVQERWGVRYNAESNAILIPVFQYGKLIGVKARNNDPNCSFASRWWAFLPYSKTQVVFGLDRNYSAIQKKNTVIIFESEKAVMQCDSFNLHCTLAIGGHSFSQAQTRIIKSLMVDKIIVAFDEGLSEEEIQFEASKLLSDNKLYANKVGYIYDKDHKFLQEGSKDSPSDHGEKQLKQLLKHCVRWICKEN